MNGFRPVREAIASYVETSNGSGVMLVVPVLDFFDPVSRVHGYLKAVNQLLEAAGV